jgi:NAD(P)-dependent dehydrogenase (short-subunit alcohol dehydrogenase family)
MELDGKVVVVTGSGGGIGEAFARRFTAEGARVVVTDIDSAAVERVSGDLDTVGVAVDITREDNVQAVATAARDAFGRIDIWYSNAGYSGPPQPGDLQTDEVWDLTWNLHVLSHLYAARAVLPEMVERGEGYLLNTASVVALSTQADKVSYSVTKHAALSLAEWLAVHYRPRGVRVSCFCPSAMLTPMLLSNDFPPGHPIFAMAMSPEDVASVLVDAIRAEKFLIETEPGSGAASLRAKADDYDAWIDQTATPSRMR